MKLSMKYLMLILATTIFVMYPLTAADGVDDLGGKVSDRRETDGYWFFSGFDFLGYKPESKGLDPRIDAEIETIRNSYISNREGFSPYSIVGHSQGGLRVLAYATRLKEQYPDEYENLKAVITVSGIDKGLKALEGDAGPLVAKMRTDLDIVLKGYKAIISGFPGIGLIAQGFFIVTDAAGLTTLDGAVQILSIFVPSEYRNIVNYVKPAFYGQSLDTTAEIRDMVPRSQFIKDNVAEIVTQTVTKKVGTTGHFIWKSKKVWFFTVWYPVYVTEPIYKDFTIYTDTPLFDDEIPVGYIVGTDSDTISMMGAEGQKVRNDFIESNHAAIVIHSIRSALIYGLFLGSPGHIANARKAINFAENLQNELDDWKGSPDNDGLVAKESQYYPKDVHEKVLGNSEKGYIEVPLNHMLIDPGLDTEFNMNGEIITINNIIRRMQTEL